MADQFDSADYTPPETARFWRLNTLDALNDRLLRPQPPQDPEERDRIKQLTAELAENKAKEAAVQARLARRVQSRHRVAKERLAKVQNTAERSDPLSETQENTIALHERMLEKPHSDSAGSNQEPIHRHPDKSRRSKDVPEAIAKRYLKVDDRYFMPDKTLAFEDLGNLLKLKTENHTVICDALAIAETRGWQCITVSGSQNFKQQVWREASLKDLEVTGYQPTELEIAEMNHTQILRESRQDGTARRQSPISKVPTGENGALSGILLAHGAGPYHHDPSQALSYYVTLAVDDKEMTLWGADFKRAFKESHPKPEIGDTIILSKTGQRHVDISSTVLDSHGQPIKEKKAVLKTTWRVEKAAHPDTLEQHAQALRVGQDIERRVIDQMPQLAAALAVSKLGEKIAQKAKENGVLKSQDEVDTVVYLIREGLAAALENGKHIKTPEIQAQGQHAAVDANSIVNDHQPPEMSKETHEKVMTR